MKTIPLTKNAVAIVDDEDYEMLTAHSWHLTKGGYAACRMSPTGRRTGRPAATDTSPRIKTRIVLMHRLLAGAEHGDGSHVDHDNEDKLDNRRGNLIRTIPRKHFQRHAGSVGHVEQMPSGRWRARCKIKRRSHPAGTFDTEAEARAACVAFFAALDAAGHSSV